MTKYTYKQINIIKDLTDIIDIFNSDKALKYSYIQKLNSKDIELIKKLNIINKQRGYTHVKYYCECCFYDDKLIGVILFQKIFSPYKGLMCSIITYDHTYKIYNKLLHRAKNICNYILKVYSVYFIVKSDIPFIKYKDVITVDDISYYMVRISKLKYLIVSPYDINKRDNYMKSDCLHKLLNDHGFQQLSFDEIDTFSNYFLHNEIDYVYMSGWSYATFNPIIYKIPKYLSNKTDRTSIYPKNKLYEYLEPVGGEKYVSKVWNADQLSSLPHDGVFIIKPVDGFQGYYIKILTSDQELIDYKKMVQQDIDDDKSIVINDHNYYIRSFFKDGIILNEYFTDLLLFNGRKFHIRSYFMLKYYNGSYSYSYFKKAKILTAKLPYVKGDWFNKEIHDTHIKSTDDDYYFPGDLDLPSVMIDKLYRNIDDFYKKLYESLKMINPPQQKYIKNYFHIIGCDIFILKDMNIKLIEVNSRELGFGFINDNEKSDNFACEFYTWIYENTAKEVF